MKRFLAVLMALVMLFSMAACTGSGDDDSVSSGTREFTTGYDETKYNAPGTFPIFKEKQTITVTLADQANVENYDTNKQTLYMEEQLNADLVLNLLPNGEYTTRINLMAAAGGEEFTDVICGGFGDGMIMNLADAGVIVPITEYAYNKDIGVSMVEAIDRLGWNYYPYITMVDGEMYYLPRINDTMVPNNSKMWFYKPWFEAAGIDTNEIHTTEDFKEALLKVVKSDPNGNGKADEVGISSYATSKKWMHYLMNAFVYAGDTNYMYVKDGELGFAFQRDEWKEGLKYIKELYDLGLIDPLSFSQNSAGFKSMVNYDETIVAAWAMTDTSRISEGDPRRSEYMAIPPLNSAWADGKPLSVHTPIDYSSGMVVSLNAKDPEVAFRFGDYMCNEEVSMYSRYGEKGVDWIEAKEGDVSFYSSVGYDAYFKDVASLWGTKQNAHWYGGGPYIRGREATAGAVVNDNIVDQNYAANQILYIGSNPEEEVTKLIYTEEEDEVVSENMASIKTFVDENAVKFITGALDLEKDWETFQSELAGMNTEGILECAQAAYDRMQTVSKR